MKIEMCDEFYYRVMKKDFFQELNTSKENVLRNNNKIELYIGEWVKVKQNDFKLHFVKPTETLVDIAKIYNVSVEKLSQDNNLTTNKLFIGQILKIYKQKT